METTNTENSQAGSDCQQLLVRPLNYTQRRSLKAIKTAKVKKVKRSRDKLAHEIRRIRMPYLMVMYMVYLRMKLERLGIVEGEPISREEIARYRVSKRQEISKEVAKLYSYYLPNVKEQPPALTRGTTENNL